MTIPATPRRAPPQLGNGVLTVFSFPFAVFEDTDVKVVLLNEITSVETVAVLATNYTVTRNANQEVSPGGTVNFLVAPTVDQQVTLVGGSAYQQQVALPDGGAYRAENVEQALDALAILTQQLKEEIDRCVKAPVSENDASLLTAAILTADVNALAAQAAAVAAAASALSIGTSVNIRPDLALSSGSSLVGFIQSGANTVPRTVQGKLRDSVSVFDFLPQAERAAILAGTSTFDATAGIIAAAAEAAAQNIPLEIFGTLNISATINLSAVLVTISHNATFKPTMGSGIAVEYSAPAATPLEERKLLGNLNVLWPRDWTQDRTSFFFQNTYNGEFHISSLQATRGVVCNGNLTGVVHCDFHLGRMFANNVGVWLDSSTAAGWCNMNRFHGGFFFGSVAVAGSLYAAQAGHIFISGSPYLCNGNVFLYPSLEWVSIGSGFRLARLAGTRNKLIIGYAESDGGDTTWFVDTGTTNLINAQYVPYAIGYDPYLAGNLNRIDVSGATLPWVLGTQGFLNTGSDGSQIYVSNRTDRGTMELRNSAGPALILRDLNSAANPALHINNAAGGSGVRIPAAGVWTVFNGTLKISWSHGVAPITGTWAVGDMAYNNAPASGGFIGWVCTVAGTPGTWRTFGAIT